MSVFFARTPEKLNIVFCIDLYNILCYTLPVNEFAQFPLLGAWVDWPVCGAIHLCTLSGLYVYVSSIAAP